MSLLVKLTETPSKNVFFIDAACVRMIAREGNVLETIVQTYQGNAYKVSESPEEVARLVNIGRQEGANVL